MADWKEKVKGLQPKKSSGSSSLTGLGLRDKASGLMGRGGNDTSLPSTTHVSRPISQLRDPASFPPPPKRGDSHPPPVGQAAPSSQTLGPAHANVTPAPLPPAGNSYSRQQEGVEAAPAQPKPWKLDTTGLSTTQFPPPPGRRDTGDGSTPPPPYSPVKTHGVGPPSLPPRLPPRSGAGSPAQSQSSAWLSQPTAQTQGAMNRLGAAGISVPGLGIGKSSPTQPPPPPARSSPTATASSQTTNANSQMNELQSRLSRFGTSSSPQSPSGTTPPSSQGGGGTTLAQKQAALRTASSFHKDPSSVSFSDARAAAATANNFRQRHGEQVTGGLRAASGLGQRFGVTGRANFEDETAQGAGTGTQPVVAGASGSILGKKKPPAPPPPKKKAELSSIHGTGNHEGEPPPPVPLATRPTF